MDNVIELTSHQDVISILMTLTRPSEKEMRMAITYLTIPPLTTQIISEFESNVIKASADECWLWSGSKTKGGYGNFVIDGKTYRSNRVAYMIHRGDDPGENVVRHTCNNPPCCNGAHLILGTHADNSDDMARRLLEVYGMRNPSSKLTPEQHDEIRKLYSEGGITQFELAARFGINRRHVQRIIYARRTNRDGTFYLH